ncbi:MAG TPA: DUF420 domain-containing protein [Blastocatellia bacterium]|jgi:uncharacterized membrane protein YozB (DUF420 family)
MSIDFIPTLNAMLNATSGLFLITGFLMIRRRKIEAHRFCMLAAVTASILFLISYVIYHVGFAKGISGSEHMGRARPVYLTILTSHTILAITIVPFVIITFRRAFRRDFARHRKIARWTFPLWLYVSVTGVIVYLMLYHIYPR